MDILFPWRKGGSGGRDDAVGGVGGGGAFLGWSGPGLHGSGGGPNGGGKNNNNYNSLPHPQEHVLHYGSGKGDTTAMAGGGRRGGNSRSTMNKTESQRLFGSGTSTTPSSDHHAHVIGGGDAGGGGRGKGGGGGVVRAGRLRGGGRRCDGGGGLPGGAQFRPPPSSLDNSNRSAESELSGTTGVWNQRGGVGGPPHPPRHHHHPPPQSRFLDDYQGDYYEDMQVPPLPPQPPPRRKIQQKRENGRGGGRRGVFSSVQQSPLAQSHGSLSTQSLREMYDDDDEDYDVLPVSPLRQILDAINMSILPTSLRLSSLAQAVEFFDHRDRAMHDAELREGGAFVLYHKLGLVLRLSRCGEAAISGLGGGSMDNDSSIKRSAVGGFGGVDTAGITGGPNHLLSYQRGLASSLALQQQSEFDKEIAMVCSCLEMVHRANPDAIAQTWDECGVEILPLLVEVLERPFQNIERAVLTALQEKANVPGSLERAVAVAVTRDQKLAVQKATKVLAMYSLVPEAKRPMCHCEAMLRWLTRIIDTHNYNRVKPGAPVIGGMASAGHGGTTESVADGEESDDKLRRAKRLELATRATSGAGLYMTEAARFNTIATLTNLAAHEANRMRMLQEPGLLDNICRVVHNERSDVPKQCSALAIMNLSNGDMDHVPEMARNDLVLETLLKLIKEDNPETRRNAVVTIFNVACSDQNTVRLARYRDGTVLEALVELVGSDDVLRGHDEARANAAETLFNMACSEISETTDRMANHAGLLECLAVTLRGEHTGLEVKMYCSATLRRMAEIIRHPMIAQGALLSALVKAATWTSTDCIAEAFRAQASVPENCVIMAHHHGLLNALSRLALTRGDGEEVEKVRMASCLAIELMSRQDEARAILSQNEGIIMALTKASYGNEQQEVDHRRSEVSEMNEDASRRFSEGTGAGGVSDDDTSMSSRRIQLALKNLVAAM